MISVICCYSDQELLNSMLAKSLKKQNCEYETIFVDNTNGRFTSAAAALNFGFSQSKGEYVIFAHQDITFNDLHLLEKIKFNIDLLKGNVIVGLAGVKEKNKVYTNIKHGVNHEFAGKCRLETPIKIQTLDEVLIATKRKVFEEFMFDEVSCDNWHLYGVDLCLSAKKRGVDSYVIPLEIYHKSTGNVDDNYLKTLGKVVKKHKKYYKNFVTTNSFIKTKYFNKNLYPTIYKLKKKLVLISK